MSIDLKQEYINQNALLEGHFLLSSGKHSQYYLQSAKVLEQPSVAAKLLGTLAQIVEKSGIEFDTICSPALGGLIAGYELARQMDKRFIFVERVGGEMTLRRGFEVRKGEKILVCEDIITTAGSALEAKRVVESLGAEVVAFAAIANRGVCKRAGSNLAQKPECKLPSDIPLFAIDDFIFEIFDAEECPFCKLGSKPIKPGSRGN